MTVPNSEAEKADGPLDEDVVGFLCQLDRASGEHLTEKAGSIRGASDGESGEQANHLLPSSVSSPLPEEGANRNGSLPALADETKARKPKPTKSAKVDGSTVPIPPELDIPEFRETWGRWFVARKELKKPVYETAARQQLADLAPLGPMAASACLTDSIRNGWAGIFPDKFRPRGIEAARPIGPPVNHALNLAKSGVPAAPMAFSGKVVPRG